MKVKSTNRTVQNAIEALASNRLGVVDYSRFKPQSKWDVLDDLEPIGGDAATPGNVADLKRIKPYAQKFGAMDEFNRVCRALGVSL